MACKLTEMLLVNTQGISTPQFILCGTSLSTLCPHAPAPTSETLKCSDEVISGHVKAVCVVYTRPADMLGYVISVYSYSFKYIQVLINVFKHFNI